MPQKDFVLLDIANPQDPRLPEFYELYGKVFTLPEEREPIEGFRTVLGLTADPAVARDFGPISERITLAIDPGTGKVIGATNYIYYGYGETWAQYGAAASCQLNFICVDPDWRGQGVAPHLLRDMEDKLANFAKETVPAARGFLFVTCEQNNPARMTQDQLAADIRDSGMDPNARLAWWVRQGYRRLDFAYRQPPLNPGQEACTYLDYYVRFPAGEPRPTMPAALLAEHLRRFFFVSVGKLQVDMQANPEWRLQRHDLAGRDTVAVVPSR